MDNAVATPLAYMPLAQPWSLQEIVSFRLILYTLFAYLNIMLGVGVGVGVGGWGGVGVGGWGGVGVGGWGGVGVGGWGGGGGGGGGCFFLIVQCYNDEWCV